jgi:hypothetical protein
MHVGAVVTVALPPRYEGTTVTVMLVGKTRALVELPNGSQMWIANADLHRRGERPKVA